MTDDHGPSIKDDEQYEALRAQGASKEKAAGISNAATNTSRRLPAARAQLPRAATIKKLIRIGKVHAFPGGARDQGEAQPVTPMGRIEVAGSPTHGPG